MAASLHFKVWSPLLATHLFCECSWAKTDALRSCHADNGLLHQFDSMILQKMAPSHGDPAPWAVLLSLCHVVAEPISVLCPTWATSLLLCHAVAEIQHKFGTIDGVCPLMRSPVAATSNKNLLQPSTISIARMHSPPNLEGNTHGCAKEV